MQFVCPAFLLILAMLTSLSLTSGIFAFSNKAILGLLLNNLALFPNAKVGDTSMYSIRINF